MQFLKRFINDLLTGIDGLSFDPWRLAALVSLVVLFGNASYANFRTHAFSAQDFGIGVAAILAGAGWGIKQKKDTEPPAPGSDA